MITNFRNKSLPLIIDGLPKNQQLQNLIDKYKNTPSFYYFQKDARDIYDINLKLTLLFIGYREAIKGWVVAAKKITDTAGAYQPIGRPKIESDDFIYDQYDEILINKPDTLSESKSITTVANQITPVGQSSLDIDFSAYYYRGAKSNFDQLLKTESFWTLRIGIEEMALYYISILPNPLLSSINTFYELTKKYPNFTDLLYLMSESFPVLTIHRLLFSGYLLVD